MPSFELLDPPTRGTPQPRYFKPLVRINAIAQDAPFNWKLDLCYIDAPALAAVVAPLLAATAPQTLSIAGSALSISSGNTIQLPAISLVASSSPLVVNDPVIPTAQVGADSYLLGAPAIWAAVVVGGVSYRIPLFTAAAL